MLQVVDSACCFQTWRKNSRLHVGCGHWVWELHRQVHQVTRSSVPVTSRQQLHGCVALGGKNNNHPVDMLSTQTSEVVCFVEVLEPFTLKSLVQIT